nr:MAG TPA: hypothetical protein [Caudoviricetes sp.]
MSINSEIRCVQLYKQKNKIPHSRRCSSYIM